MGLVYEQDEAVNTSLHTPGREKHLLSDGGAAGGREREGRMRVEGVIWSAKINLSVCLSSVRKEGLFVLRDSGGHEEGRQLYFGCSKGRQEVENMSR